MRRRGSRAGSWISFLIILAVGICMIYPLVWMFFASFKTNNEINLGTGLLPAQYDVSGFIKGWRSTGQYTYTDYFTNTFLLVIPTVAFTVISSTLVSYGFARFAFRGSRLLFGIMLSTLMVPNAVLIIPRYLLFRDLNWLNTYLPFWMPGGLAVIRSLSIRRFSFCGGFPEIWTRRPESTAAAVFRYSSAY